MRPQNLQSKIFLDSGDPEETKKTMSLLGFLDGQTTNPTLVAKHPLARQRFEAGEKFSKTEIYDFYNQVIAEIAGLIPDGSVSVEVYADQTTTTDEMFKQGSEMFGWAPNVHIKYPTTAAGLAAAEKSIAAGYRVNMTLCFTEEQAAAVYAATRGAQPGDVFLSPFIGRLDDQGVNGMSLIANIRRLYETGDHHVQVLAASVRTVPHLMQSLALGAENITAPYSVLEAWAQAGTPVPDQDFVYDTNGLKDTPYADLSLDKSWQEYNIQHELTDSGIVRFAKDWNELIS